MRTGPYLKEQRILYVGLKTSSCDCLLILIKSLKDNAWAVDLISDLDAFLPHIQGVRNVINFAVRCRRKPHISFMSSISTAPYWAVLYPGIDVPELAFGNLAVAELGYGQSKIISEQLFEKAAKVCGINATVYRLPHIAGPVVLNGFWNRNEWIPVVDRKSFQQDNTTLC